MYDILLPIHIAAGFCSLLAAFGAIFTAKGQTWHVRSGRVFFWGMVIIFVTALPMTLLRPNLFLFLVAIFSFHQALTGWRTARNRTGRPAWIDWAAAGVMTAAGAGMLVFGAVLLVSGETLGLVLLAFGGLGGKFRAVRLATVPSHSPDREAAHRGPFNPHVGRDDRHSHGLCGDQLSNSPRLSCCGWRRQ